MSEVTGYRNPVMISCGSAFTQSDNSELLDRHSRYGVAFRDLSGNPSAVLTVLVPDVEPLGSLVTERDALRVYSLGPHKNPFAIGLAAGRWARRRGLLPYWIAGTPFREAIAAITAQRIRQGPLQIQAHGNFGVLSPWSGPISDRARWLVARLTFPRASSVRTVSPDQQKSLLSTFRLDPEISFVAPVPVNPVFFDPAPVPKPDDGIFRIGWFGRLHHERGLEEWISQAQYVAIDHSEIELHIIGDGPHRQEFQAKIERVFSNSRVVWWGQLSGTSLASAVSGMDLLINSFRNETFGRAMLEALLCGVPVNSVDSPGSRCIWRLLESKSDPILSSVPGDDGEWRYLKLSQKEALPAFLSIEKENILLLAFSWFSEHEG